MEGVIFQIYGALILTFVGFVLPILAIAISLLTEGVTALKQKYENEQKQAEKNLKDEFQKKFEKDVDLTSLTENINTLKLTEKRAKKRLFYLDPQNILSRSIIALGICLGFFLSGLFFSTNKYVIFFSLLISVGSLFWAMIIFLNSIKTIIEASAEVQRIRRITEEKTLELLTTLVDNSKKGDESLFIDHDQIVVFFKGEPVIPEKEYLFSVNTKHSVPIKLTNLSEYMLKTAELGFSLPLECLVDERDNISIYTGEKSKIVRFKHEFIQSNEAMMEGDLNLTFLKEGSFDVNIFIKGENLKNKNIKFKIKIIE